MFSPQSRLPSRMIARANAREIIAVKRDVLAALNAQIDPRTIRAAIERTIAVGIGGPDEGAPETAAERRERQDRADLEMLDKLKAKGKEREAVGMLARQHVDPRNPLAIASECRRLRRLWRKYRG
jgi:hypothetical protein